MRTIKFLKLAAILEIAFCLICALSVLCLYFGNFILGLLLSYFWMLNPVGPICCAVGLTRWRAEREEEASKRIIGKKWIWFIVLLLITICAYLVSAVLWVKVTGGV